MTERGKSNDLDDWILATVPRAMAGATSLLHDRAQAEDVVQDCYCRLLARAEHCDLRRDGATYSLVESAAQPDDAYQLEGHLDAGAAIFDRRQPRRRLALLTTVFGSRNQKWLRSLDSVDR